MNLPAPQCAGSTVGKCAGKSMACADNVLAAAKAACDGKDSCEFTACAGSTPDRAIGCSDRPPGSCKPCTAGAIVFPDPAGSCFKTTLIVYECSKGWGIVESILLLVLVYLVIGAASGIKRKQATGQQWQGADLLGADSPILLCGGPTWGQLPGLVRDGTLYSYAQVRSRSFKSSYNSVPADSGGGEAAEEAPFVEPKVYRKGQTVQYESSKGWIDAKVVLDKGKSTLDLNCKKKAKRSKVRTSQAAKQAGISASLHADLHSTGR